jgi:hypothetical protein
MEEKAIQGVEKALERVRAKKNQVRFVSSFFCSVPLH